jgi:hypothetical protein
MNEQSKFSRHQQQQSEHITGAEQNQRQAGQEFANADEMLRFDAAHTDVPTELEQRLKKSAGELPQAPRRSWWRNLFGG